MAQPNQVTLDIEDGEPADATIRPNTLHRLVSTREPRQGPANRHNLGLSDRLNSVFREIRPLVEQARSGHNARLSLPTWLPRNPPGTHLIDISRQRPESSIAHVNLGPNAQTFIVTERVVPPTSSHSVSPGASHGSNQSDEAHEQPEINVTVNPANNNNIHDNADNESQSDEGATQQVSSIQVVDVQSTLNALIRYAPFYLIVFIKFMYDSRVGILSFIVLSIAFVYSNGIVRREHGRQMNRSILVMCVDLFLLSTLIVMLHFMFGDGKLLPNVVMYPNYTELDIWELLWLVVLTDLMAKIITVNLKLVVTMMPVCLLPFQKRGKVYLFMEAVSQLYRAVLPVQPWAVFLSGAYDGSERIVAMFLGTIYACAKLLELLVRLRFFKYATWTLLQSVNLGTKPTIEQLMSAGESCPICHDEYSVPVRLDCSHIFCELCISAWLDREHTCPLCRAAVADEPTWRDGSTTYDLQLY